MMPEKYDYINIIFLSSDWNKYHRKAFTEELSKKLQSWSDVVLLQLPVSLIVHLFTNFRTKIIGLVKGDYKTSKIYQKAYLFTPVILFHYLFWNKNILFFKVDFFLLQYQLNRFIKKNIGIRKSIIWYYFPYFKNYVEKSNAEIKIYDQYDIYHLDIKGNIDPELKSINDELIKKSDIILNTTKYLYDISIKLNKNSYYITNGNNYNLFSKSKPSHVKINLPIKNAKTIGYLGGIRDWLDFELLEYLILKKRDINFLFIGTVYLSAAKKMDKIKSYNNVLWLNYVQPEILPSYLSLFDAGLIPFKTTEFFKCVFPNKFYEYLASGIPVITTNLPELKKYENLIGFSYNYDDFLKNCESVLNGQFNKYKEDYLKISEENSWSKKAEKVIDIVKKAII